MNEFFNSLKTVLKRKILEKSQGSCFGCILGEDNMRDHSCQAPLEENIERYFNQIFEQYVRLNRHGLNQRFKEAICTEWMSEFMESRLAREAAERACATRSSRACQVSEVSSSSDPARGV